jgi:hypothetical protein
MSFSKYNDQQFGKYIFQVCSKTTFIEAKGMFEIYNATAVKKKKIEEINEYMKRPSFKIAVCVDFDKTSKDSNLDLDYLKQLCEKKSGLQIAARFPPKDSDSDTMRTWALKLPTDLKFAYMVRKVESGYNIISAIDIHPLVGIGFAAWLSDEFSSEVNDAFLKLVTNDLTHGVMKQANHISVKIKNVIIYSNPEYGKATMLLKTQEKIPRKPQKIMIVFSTLSKIFVKSNYQKSSK